MPSENKVDHLDERDERDAEAITARRLLLRRELLAAGVGLTTAVACAPSVCLSMAQPPHCHPTDNAPLQPGTPYWERDRGLGGLTTDYGPIFEGDQPVVPQTAGTQGNFTIEAVGPRANELSHAGGVVFEALVPSLTGAAVRIDVRVGVVKGTTVEGPETEEMPKVDGAKRAAAIQAFLATKGIQAQAAGTGTCSAGEFGMTILIVACKPAGTEPAASP